MHARWGLEVLLSTIEKPRLSPDLCNGLSLGLAPPPRSSALRLIEKELMVLHTTRPTCMLTSSVALGGLASV